MKDTTKTKRQRLSKKQKSTRWFEGIDKAEPERINASRAACHTEGLFRFLVENANEVILVAQGGKLRYANQKATEITGYSKEELSSRAISDLIHPQDLKLIPTTNTQKPVFKTESKASPCRIIDKRGNTKRMEIKLLQTEWRGEAVTLYFLIDVTEQELVEKALRESEEKYRQLVDYAPAGIYEIDMTTGEFLSANDVMCEYSGYTKDEFLTMKMWEVLTEDSLKQSIERFEKQQKGEPVPDLAEYEITGKNNNKLWILVNTRMEYVDDKPLRATVVAHDITERKQLEQELQKAQKIESLGVLAGGIAHDFNNVLSAIMGNISIAQHKAAHGEDIEKLLDGALRASSRAKALTQQLLVFSKGGAPVKTAASISEVLRESTDFVMRGSKAKCEFSIAEDLWPVRVDIGHFSQVIHNLVINAEQAMPNGGVIRIRAYNENFDSGTGLPLKKGKYVKVSFQDQGIGMPQEHISKIFDPYFTTKAQGSGLGLTMVYATIKKHDGHIAVDSEEEKGTTFHIYLPAAEKADAVAEDQEIFPLRGKGKILVMDDEEIIRNVIKKMLETMGYQVECAVGGVEAIEMYEKASRSLCPFEAVIMDLTIPGGLGGKEAIQRLLKIDPQARVVVSSGYSNDPIMADFDKYGFKGVVTKPYRMDELGRILHNVLTGATEHTTVHRSSK